MSDETLDPLAFPQEEADRIFDELGELRVELDDDPLTFGPKRLNSKTSQVRRMLDRCENLFLSVSRKLQANRRALRVAETGLDINKKYLFANDPETRAGRSVSDREAIAAGKLEAEIRRAHALNVAVEDLDAVMTVIKAKRADLKDTEGRLRDQMRLCSEEIGLGSRWGSKVPNAPDIQGRSVREVATGADILDLENILQGVDGEIKLARDGGTWQDPVGSDEDELGMIPEPRNAEGKEPVPSVIQPTFLRRPSQVIPEEAKEPDPIKEPELAQEPDPIKESTDADKADDLSVLDADVDVAGLLEGTTTTDQVDIFLEEVHLNTSLSPKKPDHNKAVAEIDMDSILAAFEEL